MIQSNNLFSCLALCTKGSNMGDSILRGTRTYLAGNLESSSDTTNWRSYIKSELKKLGIISFNPMEQNFTNDTAESDDTRNGLISQRELGKWEDVSTFMKATIEKDLRLIDISDFIIFNFEFDKPTFGTTHELVIAQLQKKPIFLIVKDRTKVPLWIMGLVPEKYIYDSIDDVLEILSDIHSGVIKIDSSRWRLLKKEFRFAV